MEGIGPHLRGNGGLHLNTVFDGLRIFENGDCTVAGSKATVLVLVLIKGSTLRDRLAIGVVCYMDLEPRHGIDFSHVFLLLIIVHNHSPFCRPRPAGRGRRL